MSKTELKKPSKLWWLLAFFLTFLFLLVQIPASWVLKKLMPQQNIIENVSGNLWHGQAQWRVPKKYLKASYAKDNTPITGSFTWQWRAWELLWLQGGADIQIISGQTNLKGIIGLTKNTWQVKSFSGKLSADLLKKVLPMQWPNTDVNLQKVNLKQTYKGDQKNWHIADGNVAWSGGEIGYKNNGKLFFSNLPAMNFGLNLEKDKLHISMLNTKEERMGDIYLDSENMIDVQLTQRLLLNVKGYKGNAAPDTAVVSVRQPLSSLGQ